MVNVGNDEFCLTCMQWCEFDEEGKCLKCGRLIRKQKSSSGPSGYGEVVEQDFSEESEPEYE